MKTAFRFLVHCWVACLPVLAASVPLFDGRSFAGWEGDTSSVWRIRDGTIVGGSLQGNPRNEFLATRRTYRNFRLELEYKLIGTEGFVNSGVQFRSHRVANPPNEVSGFQADIGAGFSGCLYDESRRNRTLVQADTNLISRLERPGDWNRYEIIARGPEIVLSLNGQRTAAWVEKEAGIAVEGIIALQIHGNNKAEVAFRNLQVEELSEPTVPTETEVLQRFGREQTGLPPAPFANGKFEILPNETVAFVGQENLVRDQKAGELESRMALANAAKNPRFRYFAWEGDTVYEQWRELNFGPWIRQLEASGATIVVAQFGQMESMDGVSRLPEFITAYHRFLDQFSTQTRRMVLISPMPFEKPMAPDARDLTGLNSDVEAYTKAIQGLARDRSALFVDLYTPLSHRRSRTRLTHDGIHLTPGGLAEVDAIILQQLAPEQNPQPASATLRELIAEKNRLWFDCWRPANWSFVYGDRVSQQFGKSGGSAPSLREEFEHHRVLVEAADSRIHDFIRNQSVPTIQPLVNPTTATDTNQFLSPDAELTTFTVADGYEVQLYASEKDGVVKPTQISWDEKGRLYVACSPTYPQLQSGQKPHDYILVLEDAHGNGHPDKSWKYAEGLTMVQGVEPGDGGIYVCDFDQIVHLRDTDGDGKADERDTVLSGFGIGDTHQLVNSITHGPDGSLWFTQGLHAISRVETPWGIARLDRAAVWRMRPKSLRLDGFFGGGMAGANCWGVAFDDYGQVFHKSGDRPQGYWTVPGMVRGASPIGSGSQISADASYANSPEQYHSVGPLFDTSPKTTSLEIIGTTALPEDIQGCALIAGYFGSVVELHRFSDSGSGFKTTQLPKLLKSSSSSFRPVDVSVGPDGAIYVADWYNPIIGHYQASYADPNRDKSHGRIWRITARGRPSAKRPNLAKMGPSELLEQLRSPERWTRYQAKRVLFDLPRASVVRAADSWVNRLLQEPGETEKALLETLGVFEAHEAPRPALLRHLLNSKDARVRAYATRVLGAWGNRIPESRDWLQERAGDTHPRVRLEAVVAASYLQSPESIAIVMKAWKSQRDPFLDYAIHQSARSLQSTWAPLLASGRLAFGGDLEPVGYLKGLINKPFTPPSRGQALYEMACLPCHQPNGKGLPGVYPPLSGSEWVRGEPGNLIRILLNGLGGEIQVAGQTFGGGNSLTMPALGGLTDEQIADVLSYVRQEYGNGSSAIQPGEVKNVRATTHRDQPWTASELVK